MLRCCITAAADMVEVVPRRRLQQRRAMHCCTLADDCFADIPGHLASQLDQRDDGDAIQNELAKKTGGRSVPRVFVNQKVRALLRPKHAACATTAA